MISASTPRDTVVGPVECGLSCDSMSQLQFKKWGPRHTWYAARENITKVDIIRNQRLVDCTDT